MRPKYDAYDRIAIPHRSYYAIASYFFLANLQKTLEILPANIAGRKKVNFELKNQNYLSLQVLTIFSMFFPLSIFFLMSISDSHFANTQTKPASIFYNYFQPHSTG